MTVVMLADGPFVVPEDVAVAVWERRVRITAEPGWRPLLSGEVADLFGVLPRPVVPLDDEAQVAAVRQPRDGDGDGFVYDDTPRQRPAPVRLPKLPVANRIKAKPKQTPTATGNDWDSAYVDYRMAHQPNYGPGAYDLLDGDMLPDDVYDQPERYASASRGNPGFLRETRDQLEAVRGKRDAMVTVYRSVPPDVAARGDDAWEEGNWVSLAEGYADQHGKSNGGPDWVTISRQVPAWQVRFAGDDLMEWGWFPEGDPGGEWVSEWGGTPEPVDTASAVESPMSVDLVETVETQGGFTFDPRRGDFPSSGVAVGVSGFSVIIKHDEWVKPGVAKQAIADYLRKMRDDGVADKVFIGGWWDKEHDEVVLDRVDVFADRDEGIRAGRERGEQAVFDLGAGEEIDTGGTGGRENYEIVGAEAEPSGGLPAGEGVPRPDGSGNRRDRGDAGSQDEGTDGGLTKTAAPRVRRPNLPNDVPGGASTYLRSKGLWNDPGSGRFAPRGFSTLKALAMEFVAGEQVRNAAKTAGKVKARVADNRMSRAGISKGDVVEVVYKDDQYGKVQIIGKSGKARWYDVQWARFDEVITGDDPEPKPDVTPEPEPVKPEPKPKPPKRKTPKQARKAALALLEDVPSDAFASDPIEKYIRSQLSTTQIANDVQIQDRVMATLRRQGAISIDDSDVAVWKREVATMPGMGDTPSGIKLGSLEAATVGAIVDHNKALFNKGGYVRMDATVDDVKFDRVDTLEAINTQIVDRWLASVEDKQQTPQDRDAFIRATNLWGPDGRPDGNVVVTPDQLSPWGQTLLLLSQIATPPNWRADPGRAVFTNDERQARLAWLYDDFAPATFVTSDQEQRAAGTDPPSVSSDVVEQVLDSVDVDGLGYALESWVNRSDRDVSSGLTDRRAFADIVDYPVTDRLKTKGRERLEERGFPSTEAALEAERATNVIFGRTAVDGRLRMDEDAEIGLGVGPNLGLFTTPPSADGSFTEADLTPLGKIMYRALAGIATDQRMRGSVSSTSNTELTATDKQRLNAVVAAGRVLLDDMRQYASEATQPKDAPELSVAEADYEDARMAAGQAREAFVQDVVPKTVKNVLKAVHNLWGERRAKWDAVTSGDDYTVSMDDVGLGYRIVYPDGSYVEVKPFRGQRGAVAGKPVGFLATKLVLADGSEIYTSSYDKWRAPKGIVEQASTVEDLEKRRSTAFNTLGYALQEARYGSPDEALRGEGQAIRDSFVPEMLRLLARAKEGGSYGEFTTTDGETLRVRPVQRDDVAGFAEMLEVQGLEIDDVVDQVALMNPQYDSIDEGVMWRTKLRRPNGTETPFTLTVKVSSRSWADPVTVTVQRDAESPHGDKGNLAFTVGPATNEMPATESERRKVERDTALYVRASDLGMYLRRVDARAKGAASNLPAARREWAAEALDAGEPFALKASDGKRAQLVADAGRFIPKQLNGRRPAISVKSGSRGRSFYSGSSITMKEDSPSTALHELGHHLEKDPQLNRALWAFYVRRTGGASTPPVKLQKIRKGWGYGKEEETRPDEFFEPYAGKAYGGETLRNSNSSYELFTMGLQGVFYDHGHTDKIDDEYAAFILGSLLLMSRPDTGSSSGSAEGAPVAGDGGAV